jgi:hypothetical protein
VLIKGMIVVYSENNMKPTNTPSAQIAVIKAGGRNSYHWALKE